MKIENELKIFFLKRRNYPKKEIKNQIEKLKYPLPKTKHQKAFEKRNCQIFPYRKKTFSSKETKHIKPKYQIRKIKTSFKQIVIGEKLETNRDFLILKNQLSSLKKLFYRIFSLQEVCKIIIFCLQNKLNKLTYFSQRRFALIKF